MDRRLLCLLTLILLALSACAGEVETMAQPATEEATTSPTATALPTATPELPTTTPELPTPTVSPPTATPAPPTPTPMPVEMISEVPYIDDGAWEHLSTVYLPAEADGPFPTVVIYHSGAFWHGNYSEEPAYGELSRFFASRGYAVVVPSYRLSQTDPYPAAVEDAFCAVSWVHEAAAQYGFDVAHIATLGFEAGANLAALIGTVDEPQRFLAGCPHQLPDEALVQAVVAIGGYYDLSAIFVGMNPDFQNQIQKYITAYLEASPEEAPERYAEASPITWVDGSEPPFAIVYNRNESWFKFRAHGLAFADALVAAGVKVQTVESSLNFFPVFPMAGEECAYFHNGQCELVLADYGIPQAEAFLRDLFTTGE